VLGIAGGLIASLLPRRLLILPLLGTAAFAFAPVLKPFVRPIPAESLNDRWDAGICLQSTPSTCGAASVATILKHCGLKVSERELAQDAHSYAGGTEAWYLARAVRDRGCSARFCFSSGFDPQIPFPAVAGVQVDSIGHFIAILSRDGDRFHIGDPLNGPEELSHSELTRRYVFTGFYMPITKGEQKPMQRNRR
jgi:ABC-type bacteriocin/lantibiotic exporter with double-glycine peptidase domain